MPLKRTLTLPLLTFYGLGSIIGAGIYALIGAVANQAHNYTPFAFLIAAIVAAFTAITYAELSSRFPESAGASLYVNKAFKRQWLSGLIGWLVVATGVISSGALVLGLVTYLQLFISVDAYVLIPLIIVILGGITIWGITESAFTIFIMTCLEITGLLIIIWYGKYHFVEALNDTKTYLPNLKWDTWSGILGGSFLAFYAFIGFEDMVNVAEETKNPQKIMPIAILLAAFFSICLYILISFVTVASLSAADLGTSKTPLALIIKQQGHSALMFSIIAMVSIANGILVNIIMASRLIYGMTKLKNAPRIFSVIYEKTQVPLFSILLVMGIIIVLAYWFPITTLAKLTSTIMLCIFVTMHLSLLKIRYDDVKTGGVIFPIIFPIIGMIISLIFLAASFI